MFIIYISLFASNNSSRMEITLLKSLIAGTILLIDSNMWWYLTSVFWTSSGTLSFNTLHCIRCSWLQIWDLHKSQSKLKLYMDEKFDFTLYILVRNLNNIRTSFLLNCGSKIYSLHFTSSKLIPSNLECFILSLCR